MAIRDDFAPGEVLRAEDLNDTFASKLPFAFGDTEPTTTVDGFLWYDDNETPPAPKFWDGAAFQALTSGKILQVVRATDSTRRSTTSTTFVDVTGMSVTITPQKSDSAIVVIGVVMLRQPSGTSATPVQLTDNSNNAVSGAENVIWGFSTGFQQSLQTLFGYSTPATTSATTYKLRFRASSGTAEALNDVNTGQMYAIEVSA